MEPNDFGRHSIVEVVAARASEFAFPRWSWGTPLNLRFNFMGSGRSQIGKGNASRGAILGIDFENGKKMENEPTVTA